jgi:biotin carboxyl carrier protein
VRTLSLAALTLSLLTAAWFLSSCSAKPEGTAQLWTCPMHPEQISDRPGRCPVCKMDLVPKKAGKEVSGDSPEVAGKVPDDSQAPALGRALVGTEQVSEDSQSGVLLAPGTETEAAREESTGRTVRATATVLPDERRITQVHTRIAGWVEKLYVHAPGQAVRRGQAMLEIHSLELVASQEDLLRARAAQARFAGSSLPEVRQGGAELVAAARRRLALLGVSEAEIGRLEAAGQPRRTVRLDAPASGYVQQKEVFEGAQVEPGKALFQIVDLSRVWLEAAFP